MEPPQNNISVCVFCASSDHLSKIYIESAESLAVKMAEKNIRLVYGGGNNGLMGVLSAKLHEHKGEITGVITRMLKEMGFAYKNADEMLVTETMHERKALMEKLSDGFICLAGGFGTLEEILEILTHKQLKIIDKPIVFLNINNFFSGLFEQFNKACSDNFICYEDKNAFFVTNSEAEALDYIISEISKKNNYLRNGL